MDRPPKSNNMSDVEMDEMVFEIEEEEGPHDMDESESEADGAGITKIKFAEEIPVLTEDQLYLVYLRPLLSLARIQIEALCRYESCESEVKMDHFMKGSAIYIVWVR